MQIQLKVCRKSMQQFCCFPNESQYLWQQESPKGALNTDIKFGISCVSSFDTRKPDFGVPTK